MTTILETLAGLASLIWLPCGFLVFPRMLLKPIVSHPAYLTLLPFRFTLIDLAALIFLLTLPPALSSLFLDSSLSTFRHMLLIFGWAATGSVWQLAIQQVNAAKVHRPLRRMVFVCITAPAAYLLTPVAAISHLLVMLALLHGRLEDAGVFILASLLLTALPLACPAMTHWVLRENSSAQQRLADERLS